MMRLHDHPRAALPAARIADAYAAWLRGDGGCEIIAAADLLGGETWAARAHGLVAAIRAGAAPAARRGDVRALRRLLRLDLVDDLASPETARFAGIDPDDPRADAARLCAEALDRGLAALDACAASSARRFGEAA